MARHPTRKHGVKRGSSAGVAMSCHRVYYGPSVMVPVPVDLWSSAGVEGDQAGGMERKCLGGFHGAAIQRVTTEPSVGMSSCE